MIARPTDVLALLWVLLFGVLLGSSRTVVFPFSVKKRSASVQPEALWTLLFLHVPPSWMWDMTFDSPLILLRNGDFLPK